MKKLLLSLGVVTLPVATVISCGVKKASRDLEDFYGGQEGETKIVEVAGPDMLITTEASSDSIVFKFHGMLKKEVLDENVSRAFQEQHYFGNGIKYSFFVLEDSKSFDNAGKQITHRYEIEIPSARQIQICASEESVKKFIVDSVMKNKESNSEAAYFAKWFEWIKDAY